MRERSRGSGPLADLGPLGQDDKDRPTWVGNISMGARILVVDDSPTIRKVVARILERHNYEATFASDGVEALDALAQRATDLMLVDFAMPRMNGYELCLNMRQDERFRDVPVVLMSAREDRIRDKFVTETGALDAITKPFDARGLIAVVESALAKAQGGNRESPAGEDPASSPEATESMGTQTRQALVQLAERLADLVAPALSALGQREPGREVIARAFAHALTPQNASDLAVEVTSLELGALVGEILSGDFGSISIAEILQLLDVQQKTGALSLHHKKKRVTLFMRRGALDYASYSGLPEEFLLGRYLCDGSTLARSVLEHHLEGSRASGRLIGDYLVEHGAIDAETLMSALRRQTSELLYEVVRWRTGRFRFMERREEELGSRAQLGLQTSGLIMEGFRRVDEWRLIEDSFDFSDVLFRDDRTIDHFDEKELSAEERRVLSAIDGEATVADILDAVPGGSFETCKILYRLVNSRLVKRKAR